MLRVVHRWIEAPEAILAERAQKRSTLKQLEVPSNLAGKPAGIFFLLNEIERQKARAKPDKDTGPLELKPFWLTDEFVFL
ncbi:hypothetical protein [Ruegeria halocynthiae]|uniref:hypothetical protein n=1 Tax=Ruegeria halocynthiae TaxID=985054 RepID=UPI000942EEE7|nr:hypothetical protein [Ruegeria halocynthiae]